MNRYLLLTAMTVLAISPAISSAALLPGDIAIIGFNSDNNSNGLDDISFVALENIAAGEQINFTDNGWFAAGGFRANEGVNTYVSPGITAGTIINIESTGSLQLSTSGDQIFAYQNASDFVFGVHFNGNTWDADATSSNSSALPPALSGNINVAVGNVDNAVFNTSVLASGTKTDWLNAISNSANWTTSSNLLAMPTGTINVTGATPPPPPPTPTPSDLILSGIVDGDLPGGLPKAIELYVVNDIPDLSIYGLESANNGGGSSGPEFNLFGSATAGDFLYVTSDSAAFQSFFGITPDFVDGTSTSINGDDAVVLFKDGMIVDIFGLVDVDGTGQPWEYTDGWAYRVSETGPDGAVFILDNWIFSEGGLDGATTNATATSPFPIGTYEAAAVPEPAAIASWLLVLAGVVALRRGQRAAA